MKSVTSIVIIQICTMLDKRTVSLSIVLLIFLTLPATIVHEAGHALVCEDNFDIDISLFGATTLCYNEVENMIFYQAFGGVLASIVFISPLLFRKVRSYKWIVIPLVSLSIGHLINAIIEVMFNESYLTEDIWAPIMGVISFIVFFIILLKYDQ